MDDRVVEAARGWLGTPYVHQASTKGSGADCLGLIRGVWREIHGAEPEEPPAYTADWAECGGAEVLQAAAQGAMADGMPVFMGGDHALAMGTVPGVAAHAAS